MDAYVITFVNRRMVVTHVSGIVTEYTINDLNNYKARLISVLDRVNNNVTEVDNYIANCEASVAPP